MKRSPKKTPKKKRTPADWQKLADKKTQQILSQIYREKTLLKRGPASSRWFVSVAFCTSQKMIRLNTRFRKKRKTTDILSFPAPGIFFQSGVLGELVICLPVLRQQAKRVGHSPERELQVLLVHGLLHLLGFDHEGRGPAGQRAQREMRSWEKKLLGGQGLVERAT